MEVIFVLLVFVSLFFLILGLITPKQGLFWYSGDKSRKKVALYYSVSSLLGFIGFGLSHDKNQHTSALTTNTANENIKNVAKDSQSIHNTAVKATMDTIANLMAKAAFERKNKELVEEREKTIKAQFDSWDGSHRELKKFILKNMNDPDSYENIETNYWDMDTKIIVKTKFRGKNGFGGMVIHDIGAEVDIEGNIIKILK